MMAAENIHGTLERECDAKACHAFTSRDSGDPGSGALSPDAGLWYPRGEALVNHIRDPIHMCIVVVIK